MECCVIADGIEFSDTSLQAGVLQTDWCSLTETSGTNKRQIWLLRKRGTKWQQSLVLGQLSPYDVYLLFRSPINVGGWCMSPLSAQISAAARSPIWQSLRKWCVSPRQLPAAAQESLEVRHLLMTGWNSDKIGGSQADTKMKCWLLPCFTFGNRPALLCQSGFNASTWTCH